MTDWVSHFRKKKVQLHINVRKDLLFFIYPSEIRILVLRISESRFDLVQTFGLISSLKGVFVKYERVSWLMAKNNRQYPLSFFVNTPFNSDEHVGYRD